MGIFYYQYSKINNSAEKWYFLMKFGDGLTDLLGIECTKFYSDLLRFDIFIVQCLGVYFFPDTV